MMSLLAFHIRLWKALYLSLLSLHLSEGRQKIMPLDIPEAVLPNPSSMQLSLSKEWNVRDYILGFDQKVDV